MTKNLLVDWLNKTGVTNFLTDVQNLANKTSATNVNTVNTPNTPTMPEFKTHNVNMKTAVAPTPTVQTAPTGLQPGTSTGNGPAFIDGQLRTPANNEVLAAARGQNTQQSRFIGFQQQPQQPTYPNTTLGGDQMTLLDKVNDGKYYTILSNEQKAMNANRKEQEKYRTTSEALMDFQGDVLKNNGKMTEEQMKARYPEFADKVDVLKELQTELRPIVQGGMGVDADQLAQYYPELLQAKKIVNTEEAKKKSEKAEKTYQELKKRNDKILKSNWEGLSANGVKFARDANTLFNAVELAKQEGVVGGANDDEILSYIINNNAEAKAVWDEMRSLELTGEDKAMYGMKGANYLENLSAAISSLTTKKSDFQPTDEEMESVIRGKEALDADFANSTLKKISTELGVSADSLEKKIYRAYKDWENYGLENATVAFDLALPKSYWEDALGIKLSDKNYMSIMGLFDSVTAPARNERIQQNKQNVMDYTESVNREYEGRKAANLNPDIENYVNSRSMSNMLLQGDLQPFLYKSSGEAAQNVDNLVIMGLGIAAPEIVLPLMAADSYARESQESFEELMEVQKKMGIPQTEAYDNAQKGSVMVGLASSAVEIRLEKVLGGVETTASKAFHDILVKDVAERTTKMVAERGLADLLKQGLTTQFRASFEEGMEEVFQQAIHNSSLKKYDPDQKITEGMLESFEGGFYNWMNLLAGGGDVLSNVQQNSNSITQSANQTAYQWGAKARDIVNGLNQGAYNAGKETRNLVNITENLKNKVTSQGGKDNMQQQGQGIQVNTASENGDNINGESYTQKNKNSNTLNKVQIGLLKSNNRMNPVKITEFQDKFGLDYGQALADMGYTESHETNVPKIEKDTKEIYNEKKKAMNSVEGEFQDRALADMLEIMLQKATNTKDYDMIDKYERLTQKHNEEGLTMAEANDMREEFSYKIKTRWNTENNSDKIDLANNVYSAVKTFLEKTAEANGIKDLQKMNRDIAMRKYLSTWIGDKAERQSANNMVSLTDWVMIAEAASSPYALAGLVTKKIAQQPKVKNAVLNAVVGRRENRTIDQQNRQATNRERMESIESANEGRRLQEELSIPDIPALPNGIKLTKVTEINNPKNKVTSKKKSDSKNNAAKKTTKSVDKKVSNQYNTIDASSTDSSVSLTEKEKKSTGTKSVVSEQRQGAEIQEDIPATFSKNSKTPAKGSNFDISGVAKEYKDNYDKIINGEGDNLAVGNIDGSIAFDGKERPAIFSQAIKNKIEEDHSLDKQNLLGTINNPDYIIKDFDKAKNPDRDKINLIRKIPGTNNFVLVAAERQNGFFILTNYEIHRNTENKMMKEIRGYAKRGVIALDTIGDLTEALNKVTGGKNAVTSQTNDILNEETPQIAEEDTSRDIANDLEQNTTPQTTEEEQVKNRVTKKTPKKKAEKKVEVKETPKVETKQEVEAKPVEKSDLREKIGDRFYDYLQKQVDIINESRKGVADPITINDLKLSDYIDQFETVAQEDLMKIQKEIEEVSKNRPKAELTEKQKKQLSGITNQAERNKLLKKWQKEWLENSPEISDAEVEKMEKIMDRAAEIIDQNNKARNYLYELEIEEENKENEDHFSYDVYGDIMKRVEEAENKINEEFDKKFEKEYDSKKKRFDELNEDDNTDRSDGSEIAKLANDLNNMRNKYDRLKEEAFNKRYPDLVEEKKKQEELFSKDWKKTYRRAVWNLENGNSKTKVTDTGKNKVTNVKVEKGENVTPDNSSITGRFRNLTLEDYQAMKDFEGLEELYLAKDADTINTMLQLKDTIGYLDPEEYGLPEDLDIDYHNFSVRENAKTVAELENLLQKIENDERYDTSTITQEEYDNYDDFYKEGKDGKGEWNTKGMIEMQQDLISQIFLETLGDDVGAGKEYLSAFYDIFSDKMKDKNHSYGYNEQVKNVEANMDKVGDLVKKYGRYWENGNVKEDTLLREIAELDNNETAQIPTIFEEDLQESNIRNLDENETAQTTEEEMNKVTKKEANKPKNLVTSKSKVDQIIEKANGAELKVNLGNDDDSYIVVFNADGKDQAYTVTEKQLKELNDKGANFENVDERAERQAKVDKEVEQNIKAFERTEESPKDLATNPKKSETTTSKGEIQEIEKDTWFDDIVHNLKDHPREMFVYKDGNYFYPHYILASGKILTPTNTYWGEVASEEAARNWLLKEAEEHSEENENKKSEKLKGMIDKTAEKYEDTLKRIESDNPMQEIWVSGDYFKYGTSDRQMAKAKKEAEDNAGVGTFKKDVIDGKEGYRIYVAGKKNEAIRAFYDPKTGITYRYYRGPQISDAKPYSTREVERIEKFLQNVENQLDKETKREKPQEKTYITQEWLDGLKPDKDGVIELDYKGNERYALGKGKEALIKEGKADGKYLYNYGGAAHPQYMALYIKNGEVYEGRKGIEDQYMTTRQEAVDWLNQKEKDVEHEATERYTQTDYETLPKTISVEAEAEKMGPKRIAPDRVKRQQETYDKGLENIKEVLKQSPVKLYELGLKSDRSKAAQDMLAERRRIRELPESQAETQWNELARSMYEDLVMKDISKGYRYPDEVTSKFPKAQIKKAVDARARYEKGLFTSFSNKDTRANYQYKDEIGAGIKSQDGKPVTQEQMNEIVDGIRNYSTLFGIDMKRFAEDNNIVYVHLHGGNPFLMGGGMNIGGLYRWDSSGNRSVSLGGKEGVMEKGEDGEMKKTDIKTTTAHELTHAVDGMLDGKLFSSADVEILKKTMNPPHKLINYFNKTPEIVARAVEQYAANKIGKNYYKRTINDIDWEKGKVGFVDKEYNYVDRQAYWNQENFDKYVKPIVEKNMKEKLKDYMIEQPKSDVTATDKNRVTSRK